MQRNLQCNSSAGCSNPGLSTGRRPGFQHLRGRRHVINVRPRINLRVPAVAPANRELLDHSVVERWKTLPHPAE